MLIKSGFGIPLNDTTNAIQNLCRGSMRIA